MTQTRTLRIKDPVDLLAAVPFTLRFHPEESLVLVGVEGGALSVRVDLPATVDDLDDALGDIAVAMRRNGIRAVAVVTYTHDHALAAAVVGDLRSRLAAVATRISFAVRADGERWFPLTGAGDAADGTPYNLSSHPFTAQMVYEGEVALSSREQVADSLVGTDVEDREAVVAAAVAAARRAEGTRRHPLGPPTPEAHREHLVAEAAWVRDRVRRFLTDSERLSAEEAGRLLAAVQVIDVRDVAWAEMSRSTAARHVELWRDLTRRASQDVLAPAAALLAFAAWLTGDGALAWCAIDRCRLADPDYHLAALLGTALTNAVSPSTWRPPPEETLTLFAG